MAREALRDSLDQVGAQIRWRRARKALLEELSDHIADQAQAFAEAGTPGPEALDRAVAEMGDPVEVGRELDRLHRPINRWELAIFVAVLVCAGVAAQFMLEQDGRDWQVFCRAFLPGILMGGILFVCAWLSDYTLLFRWKWTAWAVLGGLFVLGWILAVDWSLLGSSSAVYPALLSPVAYAAVLCRLKGRGWPAILLCGLGALILPLPASMIPRLSATVLSAGAMLLVLGTAVCLGWFSCKKPLGLLCAWGPSGALGALLLSRALGSARWQLFLHPELEPLGRGWMYLQLRGGAGPDWRNISLWSHIDFMLADLSLLDGLGRWVFLLAALVFALFAGMVVYQVRKLRSRSGKLVALGAFWVLMLQAVLFVLFNLGWAPLAPLSLPFLSYGRCFMALNLLLVGIILSVFRMDALVRDGAARRYTIPRLPDGTISLPFPGGTLTLTYRRRETAQGKAPVKD